jgi:hypothetical protein
MEFSYRLTGTGWGEARVADETAHVLLATSYLTDVLAELLLAIGSLLEGAPAAECSWMEEPGEVRWKFNRADDQVTVRILGFRDFVPRLPDGEGTTLFETQGHLSDVAAAIASGIAAVLDEYGEEEYKRRWVDDPFPTELLRMVQAHLA